MDKIRLGVPRLTIRACPGNQLGAGIVGARVDVRGPQCVVASNLGFARQCWPLLQGLPRIERDPTINTT